MKKISLIFTCLLLINCSTPIYRLVSESKSVNKQNTLMVEGIKTISAPCGLFNQHKEIGLEVKITNNTDSVLYIDWDLSYIFHNGETSRIMAINPSKLNIKMRLGDKLADKYSKTKHTPILPKAIIKMELIAFDAINILRNEYGVVHTIENKYQLDANNIKLLLTYTSSNKEIRKQAIVTIKIQKSTL